jgi:GNAT superfamily N-acetyltransferase
MLGQQREAAGATIPASYYAAFERITRDSNQFLAVAVAEDRVIGTLQLSYMAHMSHQGALRALVEGVHVAAAWRGKGIGAHMMAWAIAQAKEKGCRFVQLTSNKQRKDAHRFYARLGFTASHEGFKLEI